MSNEIRDKIWDKVFEVYYDSYFYEIVCDKIIKRWQITDSVTQILVALFTSGSAISGWALWEQPNFKTVWIAMAGFAAILSIVHRTLNVTARLKTWVDARRSFANLRMGIELRRSQMEINPQFDTTEYEELYVQNKQQYSELYSNINNDFFLTKKLKESAQKELNDRLADIIDYE